MKNFFIPVIIATIAQIISIFGVFFVFGLLLSKIQTAILKNYTSSVGWRGLLWTAWLGTPVHEYSHAFFAILFHHQINDIVLFSPNASTGELGHVNHSYNQRSFYQNLGNFFIGLAPLILGPLILVLFLYLLVPRGQEIFSQLSGSQNSLILLMAGVKKFLVLLFSPANLTSYRFWIFLYLSFCIASHLAPSKSDRKSMWSGWLIITASLFILNILARLLHRDATGYIIDFSHFFAGLIVIYIYTLVISGLHFLISYLVLWPGRVKK